MFKGVKRVNLWSPQVKCSVVIRCQNTERQPLSLSLSLSLSPTVFDMEGKKRDQSRSQLLITAKRRLQVS